MLTLLYFSNFCQPHTEIVQLKTTGINAAALPKLGLELDSFDSVIKLIFKNLYRLLGPLLVIYAGAHTRSWSAFMKHFPNYSMLNSRGTFWKTILLTVTEVHLVY